MINSSTRSVARRNGPPVQVASNSATGRGFDGTVVVVVVGPGTVVVVLGIGEVVEVVLLVVCVGSVVVVSGATVVEFVELGDGSDEVEVEGAIEVVVDEVELGATVVVELVELGATVVVVDVDVDGATVVLVDVDVDGATVVLVDVDVDGATVVLVDVDGATVVLVVVTVIVVVVVDAGVPTVHVNIGPPLLMVIVVRQNLYVLDRASELVGFALTA